MTRAVVDWQGMTPDVANFRDSQKPQWKCFSHDNPYCHEPACLQILRLEARNRALVEALRLEHTKRGASIGHFCTYQCDVHKVILANESTKEK